MVGQLLSAWAGDGSIIGGHCGFVKRVSGFFRPPEGEILHLVDEEGGQGHCHHREQNTVQGDIAEGEGQHGQIREEVGKGQPALCHLGDDKGQGVVPAAGAPERSGSM